MAFFQRVMNYLLNEVLVNSLANRCADMGRQGAALHLRCLLLCRCFWMLPACLQIGVPVAFKPAMSSLDLISSLLAGCAMHACSARPASRLHALHASTPST